MLNNEDDIVRYCKPAQLNEDLSPSASAFILRTNIIEQYLSVDWLQFYASPTPCLSSRKTFICHALTTRNFPPKVKGRLAALNVGLIKNSLSLNASQIKSESSYSKLYGYTPGQDEIAEQLSQLVHEHCSPF